MSSIRTFEELKIWQRARLFCERIYEVSNEGTFLKDYSLRNQIHASSGSIMDNIAEGFERDGTKEFIVFLSYSKASCAETRSQLYRALDRKHIAENVFSSLRQEGEEIGKMIGGMMQYLKRSGIRGKKFNSQE